MSDLSDRVADAHALGYLGCLCGGQPPAMGVGVLAEYRRHLAEATEAAVRAEQASSLRIHIEKPHTDLGDDDYHRWVILGAWHGWPERVYRDALARTNNGDTTRWLVLHCNNTDCGGVLLLRESDIEDLAEAAANEGGAS